MIHDKLGFSNKLSTASGFAIVIFASSIFFLSRLWEGTLSGDAGKYALIAKNMLLTHNFLICSLNEKLYFNKPPSFFWLIALSFKIFGFSTFAARFPSALFAVIDSGLIYLLSRKVVNEKVLAIIASFIFTVNLISMRVSTDVRQESFIVFVNLMAILLFSNPNLTKSIIYGLILGLGLLAKGPFAVVGIISTLIFFLIRKKPKAALYSLTSIVIGSLMFCIYLCFMHSHYPEFFTVFFKKQILERISGSLREGQPRPFYYYEWMFIKYFWFWNIVVFTLIIKTFKAGLFREFCKDVAEKFSLFSVTVSLLLFFIPFQFIALKSIRYFYYFIPYIAILSVYMIEKLKDKFCLTLCLDLIVTVSAMFAIIESICPISFHKAPLNKVIPIVKIGLQNFKPLSLDHKLNERLRYSLWFYFDKIEKDERKSKFLITEGKWCKNPILTYGNFCIVKRKDEDSSSYNSHWLEWRDRTVPASCKVHEP